MSGFGVKMILKVSCKKAEKGKVLDPEAEPAFEVAGFGILTFFVLLELGF